jgi:hypothetical protein
MNKNESFHPKLIICDHFDEIKNQIDIKTETLLQKQTLTDNERNALNSIRNEQLEKIDQIQEKNLCKVQFDEDDYKLKWNRVLDDGALELEKKFEILKEELIYEDCVLIEDMNFISGISLWVTSGFYNKKQLEFLR